MSIWIMDLHWHPPSPPPPPPPNRPQYAGRPLSVGWGEYYVTDVMTYMFWSDELYAIYTSGAFSPCVLLCSTDLSRSSSNVMFISLTFSPGFSQYFTENTVCPHYKHKWNKYNRKQVLAWRACCFCPTSTELEGARRILVKILNMKCHQNRSIGGAELL